jgi:dihydroxyacetone kinase-like predicted kinase
VSTRHGAVSVASKEALTWAGVCKPGDVLGIVDGDIAFLGKDLEAAAVEVLTRLLGGGGELVTLVAGADAADGLAEGVAAVLERERPEVEVVVIDGGQPVYPLLIGVE